MTVISQFGQHAGQVIHGEFFLSSIEPCRNLPKNRIILEDHSGKASLLFASNRSIEAGTLKAKIIINAELVPRPMSQMMGGTLLSAKPAVPSTTSNAALTIPASQVPLKAQKALHTLVNLIEGITVPEVRACMNGIIRKNFNGLVTAKAGWSYHHAYPGGLLVHTVSVMERIQSVGSTTFIDDRTRVELMMLGGLIHDLGKSIQIHNGKHNPAIKHLRHELLNLPLCFNELTELGATWPKGATHLSRILNWLCSGTEERRRNHCIDGEFIHMMDVIDVWHDRASTTELLEPA